MIEIWCALIIFESNLFAETILKPLFPYLITGPEQVQMTVKLRHGGITMDTIDHEFTVFYTDAAE